VAGATDDELVAISCTCPELEHVCMRRPHDYEHEYAFERLLRGVASFMDSRSFCEQRAKVCKNSRMRTS
jgi:hypothetical protein